VTTALAKTRILYHLVVAQGPNVRGRVYFNDLPVYDDPPTPNHQSTTLQVNNFLIPGENEIRIEVDTMGDPASNMFWADVYHDVDETQKPVRYHSLRWPDAIAELPHPPPAPVPFAWQHLFLVEETHPKPLYADVPPEQFPREGTEELRAAVKEIHDALAERDAAKLAELTQFEAHDSDRYFLARAPTTRAERQETFGSSLAEPWDVPKWDPERLVFTPRCGGRLVHATGTDGEHAIRGAAVQRPEAKFLMNPILVRHQGRWQLYR
jgi:hypothetical protein